MISPPAHSDAEGRVPSKARPPAGADAWSTALLFLASVCLGILVCETGLRILAGFRPESAWKGSVEDSSGNTLAQRFVTEYSATSGTDRRWFNEDPSPLANRSEVDPQQRAAAREYQRRGIFPAQAAYVWNSYYVESQRCAPGGAFESFPDQVLTFVPPAAELHPRYRFLFALMLWREP